MSQPDDADDADDVMAILARALRIAGSHGRLRLRVGTAYAPIALIAHDEDRDWLVFELTGRDTIERDYAYTQDFYSPDEDTIEITPAITEDQQ